MGDVLALFGGIPIRTEFPTARPRLTAKEARALADVLRDAEWSRAGDDWPLPAVETLEEQWARAHGVEHAVAVASGTAALTLVLRALRIPAGDEVIVPAYGCPAVDVAVLAADLTPIHADLDPSTYALSPTAVAGAVTSRTAAIVAVHFAGQPVHLHPLSRVAERYGIALVEDACLAPGAEYEGRPVGTWGRAAVFSLGVSKPISGGEGGLAVTGDPALAAEIRRLRSHGADPETGEIDRPTGNYRLSALAAAAVLPQLARLEDDTQRRSAAARQWVEELRDLPVWRPLALDPRATRHAWAQFWLRWDESASGVSRERLVAAVRAEGIPLHLGWSLPNYSHPMYTPERAAEWLRARNSGRDPDHYLHACCPHAERAAFQESLLLDFPLLNGDAGAISNTAAALRKVAMNLAPLSRG